MFLTQVVMCFYRYLFKDALGFTIININCEHLAFESAIIVSVYGFSSLKELGIKAKFRFTIHGRNLFVKGIWFGASLGVLINNRFANKQSPG